MAALALTKEAKEYALEEFKRRHALNSLRKSLQEQMLPHLQTLWWCKDEALHIIKRHFTESTNHAIIDNFLGVVAFRDVRNEVEIAQSSNLMSTDGLLTLQGRQESIRTDTLGWFECTALPTAPVKCSFEDSKTADTNQWPHIHYLLQRIETLVSELGSANYGDAEDPIVREFGLCKSRTKVMVTKYAGREDDGSRYTPHVDNGDKNGRRLTAIYYLNDEWKRVHGGALRLYTKNENAGNNSNPNLNLDLGVHCDVEPVADRLVLFLSDERTPHEVLPTHKDRFAVTVWFWDPAEKAEGDAIRESEREKDRMDMEKENVETDEIDLTELD